MSGMGRPTVYDPKYVHEMLEFFTTWPKYIIKTKQVASGGRGVKVEEEVPNVPPTLNKYAIHLRVDRATLRDWADKYSDFSLTYRMCKTIQEEFLSDKGTIGEYNTAITKLMLVNHSDIKDKVIHEVDPDSKGIQIILSKKENEL